MNLKSRELNPLFKNSLLVSLKAKIFGVSKSICFPGPHIACLFHVSAVFLPQHSPEGQGTCLCLACLVMASFSPVKWLLSPAPSLLHRWATCHPRVCQQGPSDSSSLISTPPFTHHLFWELDSSLLPQTRNSYCNYYPPPLWTGHHYSLIRLWL